MAGQLKGFRINQLEQFLEQTLFCLFQAILSVNSLQHARVNGGNVETVGMPPACLHGGNTKPVQTGQMTHSGPAGNYKIGECLCQTTVN